MCLPAWVIDDYQETYYDVATAHPRVRERASVHLCVRAPELIGIRVAATTM